MDIFSDAWYIYRSTAWSLPDAIYFFLLNANAILLAAIAVLYGGFSQGIRGPIFRNVGLALATIAAISLPLERTLHLLEWRPWMYPFLIIGLIYLPGVLAFLLESHLGPQLAIRRGLHLGLAALFALNLIWVFVQ